MLYISGPMGGLPGFNYPAFNFAAKRLRDLGYNVLNPAEHFNGDTGRNRHEYLALDVIHLIAKCRSIVFLPGWLESDGAKLEAQIALYREYTCYLWSGAGLCPVRRDEVEKMLNG
jgi:hypothetical protein